eukprot:SAG11_NODE_73_length_18072_cov_8.670005_16_plen_128_part_00
MNLTMWNGFDFDSMFASTYYPYLGRAIITIESAETHTPLSNATVTAHYGGSGENGEQDAAAGIFVTRRESTKDGLVQFGGWAGRAMPKPHQVLVEAAGYTSQTVSVQLEGGGVVEATVSLALSAASE